MVSRLENYFDFAENDYQFFMAAYKNHIVANQARESVQQPLGFPTRPREDSGVPHQEPLCDKQQGGVQQEEIHPRRPRGGEELPRSGEHLFRQDFAHVLVSQTRRGEGHGVHMGGYVRRDGSGAFVAIAKPR